MRIRTEVALEDLIHQQEALCVQSAYLQKKRQGFRRFVAVYLLVAPTLLVSLSAHRALWLPVLLCSAGLSALFYARYPGTLRRQLSRAIHRMKAEGELEFSLGDVELEAQETGLVSRIAGLETKVTWAGIEKIETIPDYTYLYISAVEVCIIPHKRVLSGDLSAFLAEIGRWYQPETPLSATPSIAP